MDTPRPSGVDHAAAKPQTCRRAECGEAAGRAWIVIVRSGPDAATRTRAVLPQRHSGTEVAFELITRALV
jgi:hypothetical protein